MKNIRFTMICLLSCFCMMGLAQTNDTKVLVKGPLFFDYCPTKTKHDPQTNKDAVVWNPTNNSWIKGFKWVDDVPVINNMEELFPNLKNAPKNTDRVPMGWTLTEEGDSTVLHCYMQMPADEVTQMWVANEETAILDRETGVLYRASRTVPDMYGTHFGMRAKKGDYIDLKVYFPRLPESTKKITIYGVQNWGFSGYSTYTINRNEIKGYDRKPSFHIPKIVTPEKNYNRNDLNSWAVYDNVQLVKPGLDYEMAIWLTKDTAYLGVKCEQNWMTEYWAFPKNTRLIDQSGKEYKLREVQGLPINRLFMIKGYSGDYIAFLLKFEPIPLDATTLTFLEPDVEPFEAWGANSRGFTIQNLSVEGLRDNQKAFDYHERVVVK